MFVGVLKLPTPPEMTDTTGFINAGVFPAAVKAEHAGAMSEDGEELCGVSLLLNHHGTE